MLSDNEVKIKENLECPNELQEIITELGGFNPYGEPNFKILWNQSFSSWQGGHWKISEDDQYFTGYKETLRTDGLPYWILMQWVDSGKCIEMPFMKAEEPEFWYGQNIDPETGLNILGEYPYEGDYQIAYKLVHTWLADNKLCIEPMELNSEILEVIINIIEASKNVDIKVMIKEMKDDSIKKEQDKSKMIEDLYNDLRINPNLHASWLEDKQRELEKKARQTKPFTKKGFYQGDENGF